MSDDDERGLLRSSTESSVPAIERGARILSYLMDRSVQGASLAEIHKVLGINKSTAHSILNALREAKLAERNEASGRWSLGFKLLELGMAYYRTNPFFQRFDQVAEKIKAVCRESVYYAVMRGTQILYIHISAERSHALTVGMMPGDTIPATCSAMGKALLIDLPDAEIRSLFKDAVFERRTERSIRDVEGLIADIAAAREGGYGFNNEENEQGVCGIAAPVRDGQGRVVAGIGVAVPASRMNLEKRAELAALLLRGSRELSGEQGLPPPWLSRG
jgi:DNA-binding IclR family transcriptional regulator